ALAWAGPRRRWHPHQRRLPGLRRDGDHWPDPRAATGRGPADHPRAGGGRRCRRALRGRDERRVLVRPGRAREPGLRLPRHPGPTMSERVLILGAGFGGLELATVLSEQLGDGVEV